MSCYYVYNRGCNRELLFVKPDDDVYLLRKIRTHLPDYPLGIVVYYLMPNHDLFWGFVKAPLRRFPNLRKGGYSMIPRILSAPPPSILLHASDHDHSSKMHHSPN